MTKKLTKHGNSLALIIDRPILDLLKIDPDTELEVSTDGKRLIIARVTSGDDDERFEEIQKVIHARYSNAFRRLAE